MYKVEVEIEGVSPMKQNRITELTMRSLTGKGKKITPDELEADWENKAYKDKKGFFIPGNQFQGALNVGMCVPLPIKSNRVKMTRQKAKGTIFVQNNGYMFNGGSKIKFDRDDNAFNTKLGDLIVQSRPIFKEGWKAKFELFIAQDWLTIEALKDGIEQSGQCHGVGSWRPRFGRYIVKSIKKDK